MQRKAAIDYETGRASSLLRIFVKFLERVGKYSMYDVFLSSQLHRVQFKGMIY